MSAEFILNRVSSGTIDYGSAGRSTASKMLTPSAEVLSAMSFAGVSNYHIALFFVKNGFEEFKYDLVHPMSIECKKLWEKQGWKKFRPKNYMDFSDLVAHAIIEEYCSGNKKVYKNNMPFVDANGNPVTEARRMNENALSKIYQIKYDTVKDNDYVKKHSELVKYFDFISSEVARKVKNRV